MPEYRSTGNKSQKIYAEFLGTSKNEDENQPISIKTRISSGEEMRTMVLHDYLGKRGVKNSEKYHESLAEHSISKQGMGRKEIVETNRSTPSINTKQPSKGYGYRPGEE